MSGEKEPTKSEMNDSERDQEPLPPSSEESDPEDESLSVPNEDTVSKTDLAATEKPQKSGTPEKTFTPPKVPPPRCGSPLLRELLEKTPPSTASTPPRQPSELAKALASTPPRTASTPPRTASTPPRLPSELEKALSSNPPRITSTPPRPLSELEKVLASTPPRTDSTPPRPSSELQKILASPVPHLVPSDLSLQSAGVPAAAPSISSPVNIRRILPGDVGENITEGSVAPGNFSGSIQGEESESDATGTKINAAIQRSNVPEVPDSAGNVPEVQDSAAEGGNVPEVQDSAAKRGSVPEVQDSAAEGGKVLKTLRGTPAEGSHVSESKEPVAQKEIPELEIQSVSQDGQGTSIDKGNVPEAEQMEATEGDGCAKANASEAEQIELGESAKATAQTSDPTRKGDPNWKKPVDAARIHKANNRLGAMKVQDSPSRRSARIRNMNQTPSDSPNPKKERKTLRSETQERVSSDENISGRTRAGRLCSTSSNSEVDNSGDESSKGSKGKRSSRKDPKK